MKIMHFNINGLKANFDQFKETVYFYDVDIIALNEPRFRDGSEGLLTGYNSCFVRNDKGWVEIIVYVKSALSFSVTGMRANGKSLSYLQISLKYGKRDLLVTACYNHPGVKLDTEFMGHALLGQMSVLVGDLNAKTVSLGCAKTNFCGVRLEEFLRVHPSTQCLNYGARPTFFSSSYDTCDTLD